MLSLNIYNIINTVRIYPLSVTNFIEPREIT